MTANDNGVEEVSSIIDSIRMVLADCMTTESKAEQDECEDKDWNGDCVGKIGSGVESVVIWKLCVTVERLFVIVVVGITE